MTPEPGSAPEPGSGPEPGAAAAAPLGAVRARALAQLTAVGVDDPAADVRRLVAHVLGLDPARQLVEAERPVAAADVARLEALLARRARGEPTSRILGVRGFWTLELEITPAVLDPRPETELLVDAVLNWVRDRDAGGPEQRLRVLDLGTGSGCILLALLSELPQARGLGVDASAQALDVAARNASRAGVAGRVRWQLGDWGAGLGGPFEVIVCNPPYIASGDAAGLAPEVRDHDPPAALYGGVDGLDAYRTLAVDLARLLAPDGLAALEIGHGQAGAVQAILEAQGLRVSAVLADLAGIARAVLVQQPQIAAGP